MTKRWIYALMVAAIIVVGAIAGPVMAASQGTTAVPAQAPATPAPVGLSPDAGISGSGIISTGRLINSVVSLPNFEWYAETSPSDSTYTLVYTVPSGYKLKIDDVTISYFGASGYTWAYLLRGNGGNTAIMGIPLTPNSHFEHSFQNIVLNGGESLKVYSRLGSQVSSWTITAHWV